MSGGFASSVGRARTALESTWVIRRAVAVRSAPTTDRAATHSPLIAIHTTRDDTGARNAFNLLSAPVIDRTATCTVETVSQASQCNPECPEKRSHHGTP